MTLAQDGNFDLPWHLSCFSPAISRILARHARGEGRREGKTGRTLLLVGENILYIQEINMQVPALDLSNLESLGRHAIAAFLLRVSLETTSKAAKNICMGWEHDIVFRNRETKVCKHPL